MTALVVLLAAAQVAAAPLSIVDDAGRLVELEAPARKIVLTDGMGLVGLAAIDDKPVERLAGWNRARLDADALKVFRAAMPLIDDVPDIGELQSGPAAAEALIRMQPDLVVLDPYYNRSAGTLRLMERAGIPVAVLALTPSVRDSEPVYGLKRLAVLIGRQERGEAFSDFVGARLARIGARLAKIPEGPRPVVLFEAHAGRGACCIVAGAGQGIGDFVPFVGGHNLGADRVPGMAGQISAEFAIAARPAVYVGTGGSYMAAMGGLTLGPGYTEKEARASLASVIERPGIAETPAVVSGRAYGLWHGLAISGVNIVAIEAMAKWIRPDLFADIDPAATLEEINRRFLAVPLSGAIWTGLSGDEPEAR